MGTRYLSTIQKLCVCLSVDLLRLLGLTVYGYNIFYTGMRIDLEAHIDVVIIQGQMLLRCDEISRNKDF